MPIAFSVVAPIIAIIALGYMAARQAPAMQTKRLKAAQPAARTHYARKINHATLCHSHTNSKIQAEHWSVISFNAKIAIGLSVFAHAVSVQPYFYPLLISSVSVTFNRGQGSGAQWHWRRNKRAKKRGARCAPSCFARVRLICLSTPVRVFRQKRWPLRGHRRKQKPDS